MGQELRQVQVRFTENTEFGTYSDAIYFDMDAWVNGDITDEMIWKVKAERVDAWRERLMNPPIMPEPTPEEIQAQIDQMTLMVESFEMQKVELVNLKSIRIEEIAVAVAVAEAEALALEEKLLDEKPVEEPIGEVRG